MKKVLVFALIAVFALSLSSCGKKKEKTNTEKLCIEKGWKLKAAESSPAYVMLDNSQVTNLMTQGYLENYELDDIIKFNSNGTQYINGGSNVPETGDYQKRDYNVGKWEFGNNETVLFFQIPFFYNDSRENATIMTLSETELKVKYTFSDDPVKGQYTFYLTYEPVK